MIMISSFFGTPNLSVVITNIEESDEGKVIVFDVVNGDSEGENFETPIEGWEFVQTRSMTVAGIAVHKYGAYIIPLSARGVVLELVVKYKDNSYRTTFSQDGLTVGSTSPLPLSES